jgi:hypothetical protein
MFCVFGHIFGGTEGIGSRFHVLRSQTYFRRYQGCRVPFSCLALMDLFSAVLGASDRVFMFCAPGLAFRSTEAVRSYFSCFALPDSFSAVPRASGPVFMFPTPGLVFCRTEGVISLLHVLRSRIRFQRYRGRPIPFSCFQLPDMFLAVPRASGPFFMFCALGLIFGCNEGVRSLFMFFVQGLIFGGTEGVGSLFHVLSAQTRFRRYRGRLVRFSYLARPDSFSAVPRVSDPVFLFCVPGLIFDDTEAVGSRFHVLCSRTRFWRYRECRVPFSSFPRPYSFSTIPRASGPVFIFCAPSLIFRRYRGRQV